jgi:hypothetical protein
MASVPNQCRSDGGSRTEERSIAVGPLGCSTGAKRAERIITARSSAPSANGRLERTRRSAAGRVRLFATAPAIPALTAARA